MQKDTKAMSVTDCVITQSKDAAIREITYLINNKKQKGVEGVRMISTNY